MSDKNNQQPTGDESADRDPRLSDTWVPDTNKKPAPPKEKKAIHVDDRTMPGPVASSGPEQFDGDMTFIAPPAPQIESDVDGSDSGDNDADTNVTFVGGMIEPDDTVSEDPSIDDQSMATIVGQVDASANESDEAVTNDPADSFATVQGTVQSEVDDAQTFVAESNSDDDFSATIVGESAVGNEDQDDDKAVSDASNSFATIVPTGSKERGTDGDPFTATIVGQVPEQHGTDDPDENRTADLPPRPQQAAREANPYLTQGGNADRTFQKTAPLPRAEETPSPAANEMDATFVANTEDGVDRRHDKLEQTAGISDSGSKGPAGSSQQGMKIKSNIWTNPNTASLDELISIRRRPVSGTGQFGTATTGLSDDADFEIIEKLAEGGMGVVYVAKQKSLNRELAIKTLKASSGMTLSPNRKTSSGRQMSRADRQKREMFLSEALVTANLVHPNIIPIHELAETSDGMPYYVMKRVHGTPWNKRIREMSLQENLDVLHKACDAIAYAHHHGVINRDLKPENIMLGEFGEVLVLDWGLAVPAPHAAEQNFRSPVASYGAGTPAYMSPELWTGPPEAIGECSDIYLLGAILFEIVTGNPPHEFPKVDPKAGRSDLWQTIDKVLRINKIRDTNQSGELLDIALKSMRTIPGERFGSVLEFQFAVRNYQRHEESRRLSDRAAELVDEKATAESLGEYHTYQTASALFEESLRTWPQNTQARVGLRSTRLRYARLANQKGDYDLGLQVTAQESKDPEFQTLSKKLSQAKTIRSSVKWTALAAMLLVVALGAKSIYDNGIITNLNTEVTSRKAEAMKAVAEADQAKETAILAKTEADTARTQADSAKAEAVVALREAEDARVAAAKSNEQAIVARDEATKAQEAAAKSKMEATVAIAQAEEASKKVAEANVQLAEAEKSEAAAIESQKQAETAAKIARVEIQSQSIRGLTLNENYSDALRELDRLLDGELLPQLPETVRIQRTTELRAQREQLLKRTRRAEEPVQTQATSPQGTRLALGDVAGKIIVVANPAEQLSWSVEDEKTLQLPHPVSKIKFVNEDKLAIAAGPTLYLWSLDQPEAVELNGHEESISGLDVQQDLLLTGDESGHIKIWNSESRVVVAEMTARTSIRDVAWLPGTRDFVYAGTRGGQSADVLAYRVPADATATAPAHPIRLGQLRLSREHNDAPSKLSISPDGGLLVIGNSHNGNLFVLKREISSAAEQFPFQQPADLEREGDMSWLVTEHSRPINGLSWSRDGQKLLTASDDRTIGVWTRGKIDAAAASEPTTTHQALRFVKQLRGHGARVTQATFLDETANRISSSSTDGFSRLWDLTTHDRDSREIRNAFDLSLKTDDIQSSVPPRRRINKQALGSHYQLTSFIPAHDESTKPNAREESQTLNANSDVHRAPVRAIQFSDDGGSIVSGAADGTIAVWNTSTRQPMQSSSPAMAGESFREGHEFNVSRMKIVSAEVAGKSQRILITSGYDGSLRLWNMDTSSQRLGSQQQVISGVGLVNAFAASKDGQMLVTTTAESTNERAGSCHVWSMETLLNQAFPIPTKTLSGIHRAEVTAIAVSADRHHIATGSREGVIAIWDAETGLTVTSLRAHAKNTSVTTLEWLSDGTLLSAGLDGQLCRWSLKDDSSQADSLKSGLVLNRVVRYDRDKTPIEQFSVSPDERRLLVVSVETNRKEKSTTYHLNAWPVIDSVAAEAATAEVGRSSSNLSTPIKTQTTFTSLASTVEVVDEAISTPVVLASVQGKPIRTLTSAQWSPDSSQVLVSTDLGVQLFDSATWKVTRVFTPGPSAPTDAQFVAANDDQKSTMIATFDGTAAALWASSSGERITQFRGPFPVSTIAMASAESESLVLAGGASLRVFSGDASSETFGRPLFHVQRAHTGGLTSLVAAPGKSFAARQRLLLSGGGDGHVKLWRWISGDRTLAFVRDIVSLKSSISSLNWSPDGSQILALTLDGNVSLVRVTEAADTAELIHVDPPIQFAAPADVAVQLTSGDFSSDGQHIAIAGQITRTSESIGWILRLANAREQHNDNKIKAQGDALITAPVETRQEDSRPFETLCTFSGHGAGGISSVSFASDSPYLISGGSDGSLILWNWQQPLPGEIPVAYEAYRFLSPTSTTAHAGPITDIDFNPVTNAIASASEDHTIKLWPLDPLIPNTTIPADNR